MNTGVTVNFERNNIGDEGVNAIGEALKVIPR